MNDDRILTLRTAQVDDEALITRSQAKRLVSVSVQCDTFDFSVLPDYLWMLFGHLAMPGAV